jgi:hypothetical protein
MSRAGHALRRIQDQVSLLVPHEYLPSRYLVLYVGNQRLVPWNFAFTETLCMEDCYTKVYTKAGLQDDIDVIYDEEFFAHATKSLKNKGLYAYVRKGVMRVEVTPGVTFGLCRRLDVLVTSELEAWTFRQKITGLVMWHTATSIGRLDMFPDLTFVECNGGVYAIDFHSLATKKLSALRLRFQNFFNHANQPSLLGVGDLTSLTKLDVVFEKCLYGDLKEETLPSEIGLLTNLKYLSVQGNRLCGIIPTHIGNLTHLENLCLSFTTLSGSVPSELGKLSVLRNLDLSHNPCLTGDLPQEVLGWDNLKTIDLYASQVTTQPKPNRM